MYIIRPLLFLQEVICFSHVSTKSENNTSGNLRQMWEQVIMA
jgi:hypothetical protein